MPDVESEINFMKAQLGVELDRDLAVRLDIDPTSVAAWRRRNKVPEKYKIRFKTRRDEDSLPFKDRTAGLRDAYIFALIATASAALESDGYSLLIWDKDFELAWVGNQLANLHQDLRRDLPHDLDKVSLRQRFEKLRSEMLSTGITEWLEGRAARDM